MTLFPPSAQFDGWFRDAVGPATPVQRAAWPLLRAGRSALLIAGTGQGKTLAAWRPIAEGLVAETLRGQCPDPCSDNCNGIGNGNGNGHGHGHGRNDRSAAPPAGVRALHIAPLKALARDILVNLDPLLGEAGRLRGRPVRAALRCGDTPAAERRRQLAAAPEVLSTTPESLFVLLGSAGGRRLLRNVRHVVIDEVHAIAPDRRGAHLAITLERLDALCGSPVQRIGLSATAEPAQALAAWLGGPTAVDIVAPPDTLDPTPKIIVERPGPPLGPFPGLAHWSAIHDRLADLAGADGGLLVFCATRAQVERTAAALGERLGEAQVGAHHGSLDSKCRSAAEQAFRNGELAVLVGSASLELGLDLGRVERVAQVGAPGGLNALRQRAGRSRHRPGARSQLHWFPLTRHQLLELEAMHAALEDGAMDRLAAAPAYRDVLAQQLHALVAFDGLQTIDAVHRRVRGAWPWRQLEADALRALAGALGTVDRRLPPAQRPPALAFDPDTDRLQVPAGLHRLILANAGTIPEWFEYRVVAQPGGAEVGRLDEEFAFESSPGQVIQLGHRRFRILRVRCGQVDVEPADREPAAELPFWFGDGPGRTDAVRHAILARLEHGLRDPELLGWMAEAETALGALPGPRRLVVERFFDPNGDRHLVLHTFAGARINRAWGLALRKRFCRQFNFELQAAATDDGVLISLGVTSQFDAADVVRFVRADSARDVLVQALLDTPLFLTRFRWAANTALLLPRVDHRGPVPAQQQRSRTENLVACVFPDQLACLENLSGPRAVPEHPLVRQALDDCLHEHMDVDGLIALLAAIEGGEIDVHAVDLERPSPLAEGLIHAPRHSYLDDAAAEERRTRSFEASPGRGRARARPAPTAVRRSAPDAPPATRSALRLPHRPEALERLLRTAGFLTAVEGERGIGLAGTPAGGWAGPFATLVRQRRAIALRSPCGPGPARLWVTIERLPAVRALWPDLEPTTWLPPDVERAESDAPERALRARRRRLGLGWPDPAGDRTAADPARGSLRRPAVGAGS
ncbi:DEAD/DEAH box helicase [Wenzhouxiangella sp. XN79A]|uniref:DEAD/DEAH box helicase n=1 Tax=Wenzhouxiangella sp. XN79A TaxID=2724193 RepID=UPI00144ACE2B|nr:DEAD/DEAH box helicase [Wenzhouxiangella sp. XN79A]NKI34541.1 DEAD/DEAH box helicase [Wenzhouxiangella sp. XN79A]